MKLITLDWEGTLVDFQWNLEEAVAETITLLERHGIPRDTFRDMDYAAIYNLVEEKGTTFNAGGLSLLSLVDEVYDRYDLDAASRWSACEEMEQTLAQLQDYKLALVSNVGRKGIEKLLDRFSLWDRLGLVLTRDDLPRLKPDPCGLQAAMAWAGAGREETLHVGDSLSDVFAARNAGVKIAVVLGGQNTPEALLRENPDLVLDKLSRLPTILQ